ncbi:MAG: hypothetical protein K2G44_05130 [Clostridia bacterium]|nr:hypothetical protein [Clostridia bacterium]
MEIDVFDLKGIEVGNWIESEYFKGYFRVDYIKECYRERNPIGYQLFLRKGFTPKMKFMVDTKMCHVGWCKKVSEEKLLEIENFFAENPDKKQKFDNLPPLYPCYPHNYFLNITEEQVKEYEAKLKDLPKYFTINKFNKFVEQIGLRKFMRNNSKDPKNAIMLTICSEDWTVDSDKNRLYCNPHIGNAYGKLAMLNLEEYNEF